MEWGWPENTDILVYAQSILNGYEQEREGRFHISSFWETDRLADRQGYLKQTAQKCCACTLKTHTTVKQQQWIDHVQATGK